MSKLKVLYFSAPWCGPCRAFKPAFDEVVKDYEDIDIERIDADQDKLTTASYDVTSIPTLIFVKNDQELERHKGIMSKSQLKSKIDEHRK